LYFGVSLAFFTNYMVLQLAKSDSAFALKMKFDEYDWRWMLGLETIPAVLYFLGLFLVPRSPRWLILKGRFDEAKAVMTRFTSAEEAEADMAAIRKSLGRRRTQ
jgi:SP family arabinose:H+ symporter-like MFS transporter